MHTSCFFSAESTYSILYKLPATSCSPISPRQRRFLYYLQFNDLKIATPLKIKNVDYFIIQQLNSENHRYCKKIDFTLKSADMSSAHHFLRLFTVFPPQEIIDNHQTQFLEHTLHDNFI